MKIFISIPRVAFACLSAVILLTSAHAEEKHQCEPADGVGREVVVYNKDFLKPNVSLELKPLTSEEVESLNKLEEAREIYQEEEAAHYSEAYMIEVCEAHEAEQAISIATLSVEPVARKVNEVIQKEVSEETQKYIYGICEKYGLVDHYENIMTMFSYKSYEYDNEGTYDAPLYDIDLPRELQAHTYQMCVDNGILEYYETILSLMYTESRYQYDAVNYNGTCYGIMQIHLVNYGNLAKQLGALDLFDPKDNIRAGVYMLAPYFKKYQDVDLALMAYNHGESGAKKKWEEGIYETTYTTSIASVRKTLATQ